MEKQVAVGASGSLERVEPIKGERRTVWVLGSLEKNLSVSRN